MAMPISNEERDELSVYLAKAGFPEAAINVSKGDWAEAAKKTRAGVQNYRTDLAELESCLHIIVTQLD